MGKIRDRRQHLGRPDRRDLALPDLLGQIPDPPAGDHECPPFVDRLLAEEQELYPRGPHVLAAGGASGEPLRHSNFWYGTWDPARTAAGLDSFKIHELRHTCAALLIAKGAHPKAIQQHLGHSTITVTMDLYGHLFPDQTDRLAAALDATWREARERPAASPRPGAVTALPGRSRIRGPRKGP